MKHPRYWIALWSVCVCAAANLDQSTGAGPTISLVELSSQINRAAVQHYGGSVVSPFLDEQLALLWKHFSDDPPLSEKSAAELKEVWSRPGETADKSAQTLLTQEILGRIWQTYHYLVVSRQPLSADESVRKATQLRQLSAALQDLAAAVQSEAEMPPELSAGVRTETERSLARLQEYANSPAYPLLYRPLSDDDFDKVMAAIQADFRDRIRRMVDDLPRTIERVENRSAVKDKASRQFLYRTGFEEKGATFAALAMGNIVRQYCMLGRKVDYSDPKIFPPFLKINGAGIAYRMSEGVAMRLGIEGNL